MYAVGHLAGGLEGLRPSKNLFPSDRAAKPRGRTGKGISGRLGLPEPLHRIRRISDEWRAANCKLYSSLVRCAILSEIKQPDDGYGRAPPRRSPKEQAGVANPRANLSGSRTAP